jgi:hypothetical protein
MEPIPPIPKTGPAWAAILAAGIGCAAFGVVVDLAEAFPRCSKLLNIYPPSGDLSGKSAAAVIVWIVAWLMLHFRWNKRDIARPGLVSGLTFLLVVVGLVAVFPPFIELFSRK